MECLDGRRVVDKDIVVDEQGLGDVDMGCLQCETKTLTWKEHCKQPWNDGTCWMNKEIGIHQSIQ